MTKDLKHQLPIMKQVWIEAALFDRNVLFANSLFRVLLSRSLYYSASDPNALFWTHFSASSCNLLLKRFDCFFVDGCKSCTGNARTLYCIAPLNCTTFLFRELYNFSFLFLMTGSLTLSTTSLKNTAKAWTVGSKSLWGAMLWME